MGQHQREPLFEELLRDPIARLLMRSDGVEEAAVRRLLEQARRRLEQESRQRAVA